MALLAEAEGLILLFYDMDDKKRIVQEVQDAKKYLSIHPNTIFSTLIKCASCQHKLQACKENRLILYPTYIHQCPFMA